MINWPRVRELRDEVGAEDFEEVVELFLEEVQEVLDRIGTTPDPTLLEGDMHFLKGSALSLGFLSFSDLCQTAERIAAQGDPETIDIAGILAEFDASKSAFSTDLAAELTK